jgi:hypothetical protein
MWARLLSILVSVCGDRPACCRQEAMILKKRADIKICPGKTII